MRESRRTKGENWMIALMALTVLCVFVGLKFDYFYDLNDDVLMKDILAGAYTGTPEGHNIQMLWLISAFISLFYRAVRTLPWYGLFLCACHFGCFFLILKRSLEMAGTGSGAGAPSPAVAAAGEPDGPIYGRSAVAAVECALFLGLFLEHLVFAQYTVTCTLLGGTAAFLFYTSDIALDARGFIKKNIPSVLLVSVAYLIRSEMLLLVLPMICVAGVAKWGSEEKVFTREHAFKYLTVIGLILAGIAIGQVSHMIAYSSGEWRAFTEFFNNRTELYDFQAPPDYKEHQGFYESIGLSESEKVLLDNYNFGMDEEIDEVLIGEIAEYAGQNRSAEKPFLQELPNKLRDYAYRFFRGPGSPGSDYPWNYVVILGYIAAFLTSVPLKHSNGALNGKGGKQMAYMGNAIGALWKLAFLFGVRTVLWMYILMRERVPERITHSLYLMELLILVSMVFVQWSGICGKWARKCWGSVLLIGFGIIALLVLPGNVRAVAEKQRERERVNSLYGELYGYFSDERNAGNFYFIDVYSSVSDAGIPYSEKMFADVDNTLDNHDIMGGWACKSPLQKKKLAVFGIDSMEQALKDREDVYFVRKNSEDMQWLFDYYEGHGTPVDVWLVETVADVFEIYGVFAK